MSEPAVPPETPIPWREWEGVAVDEGQRDAWVREGLAEMARDGECRSLRYRSGDAVVLLTRDELDDSIEILDVMIRRTARIGGFTDG